MKDEIDKLIEKYNKEKRHEILIRISAINNKKVNEFLLNIVESNAETTEKICAAYCLIDNMEKEATKLEEKLT